MVYAYFKIFPRSLFHLGILDPYSLLCPKIGEIVVHGSILEKNHKAVLFIGRSGSGKSTVTHKLSKYSEVNKLCDDTFIISFENNKLLAHSIDTGFGYDIDIAKSYIETGLYYELYNWGNKSYIFKKEKYSSVMIEPALIVFLNRIISDEDISSTSIKKITKIELLRFFINNQTNISSPFLIEKMRIYKSISNILPGIYIDFINDCDISNLNDCIKEYLTFI